MLIAASADPRVELVLTAASDLGGVACKRGAPGTYRALLEQLRLLVTDGRSL